MSLLPETDYLTKDEMNFHLKGKTAAGRRWNQNYQREVAEYQTAIDESDSGLATSKAADIRKVLSGVRRLAEATRGQSSHIRQ